MSYIEREKLLKKVVELESLASKRVYDTPTNSPAYQRYSTQMIERASFIDLIKEQPIADVAPIGHGYWSDNGRCSCCEAFSVSHGADYCPNCGSRMDGERSENGKS